MLKFKIGDRVEIVNCGSKKYHFQTGTVIRFQAGSDHVYIVKLDNRSLGAYGEYGAREVDIEFEGVYNSPLYQALR